MEKTSENISEKALFTRIITSVAVIILCLVAMGFSAYAYFSAGISSVGASMSSAVYDLVVSPPEGLQEAKAYDLGEGEYVFTLSCVDSNSTASVGYCKILVKTDANDPNDDEDVQVFYTKPIWNSDGREDRPNTRSVKIIVPQGKSVSVTFIPQWGSCSSEAITDEEIKEIKFKQ